MNSGVVATDELKKIYADLKKPFKPLVNAIILSINDDSQVVVEHQLDGTKTFDDIIPLVPQEEGRIIVCNYIFENDENPPRKIRKIVAICWAPEDAPSAKKIVYSSNVKNIASQLGAVDKTIQASNLDELSSANVRDHCL